MDILEFREFCLALPLSEETTPFDEDTLVYKIGGKMYTACSISRFETISLKCDPDMLIDFCERYSDVSPAFHFNKKHWISLRTQGDLKDSFMKERIRDSYRLAASGLTAAGRTEVKEACIAAGMPELAPAKT